MTNITKEVTRKMPRMMAKVNRVERIKHRRRRLFSNSAVIGSKSSVASMWREFFFTHDADVKNAPHLLSLLVSDEDDDECEMDADAWEWLFFFLL